MSKERYNQIIDWAYENYLKECKNLSSKVLLSDMQGFYKGPITPGPQDSRKIASPHLKEDFINKIKNDSEFSEKWGLKIEERELNIDERKDIWNKDNFGQDMSWHNMVESDVTVLLNEDNIQTKLITLTYNNTFEVYE